MNRKNKHVCKMILFGKVLTCKLRSNQIWLYLITCWLEPDMVKISKMMLSCCDGNYSINFLTIDNIDGRKSMDYLKKPHKN